MEKTTSAADEEKQDGEGGEKEEERALSPSSPECIKNSRTITEMKVTEYHLMFLHIMLGIIVHSYRTFIHVVMVTCLDKCGTPQVYMTNQSMLMILLIIHNCVFICKKDPSVSS